MVEAAAQHGPQPDVNRAGCPSRLVLEHVTSRWGVLALAAPLERSYRFSELRRARDAYDEARES
ncbi:hypothetical protein Misp01_51470 [Microtetraspora sp. NBRC 13810]|nr:hypothetical protein Misp01_51470 [Microtetraspora sp. NBRC 13810]